MATKKRTTQPVKLTAAEAREKVEELQYKLDKYAGTAHCPMCNKPKDIETKFMIQILYLVEKVFRESVVIVPVKSHYELTNEAKNMSQRKRVYRKHYIILTNLFLKLYGMQVFKNLKIWLQEKVRKTSGLHTLKISV